MERLPAHAGIGKKLAAFHGGHGRPSGLRGVHRDTAGKNKQAQKQRSSHFVLREYGRAKPSVQGSIREEQGKSTGIFQAPGSGLMFTGILYDRRETGKYKNTSIRPRSITSDEHMNNKKLYKNNLT